MLLCSGTVLWSIIGDAGLFVSSVVRSAQVPLSFHILTGNMGSRPYASGGSARSRMTLSREDFLQRWLLHVPVSQSRVVRSYGLYHHTSTAALTRCRTQLGQPPVVVPVTLDWQTACAQRGDVHPERCPACGQRLVCTGIIPRGGAPPFVLSGAQAA